MKQRNQDNQQLIVHHKQVSDVLISGVAISLGV